VQNSDVATTQTTTAYRIAPFPMTLSDLQGHSPIASLIPCDFSHNSAASDKVSSDIERRDSWSRVLVTSTFWRYRTREDQSLRVHMAPYRLRRNAAYFTATFVDNCWSQYGARFSSNATLTAVSQPTCRPVYARPNVQECRWWKTCYASRDR